MREYVLESARIPDRILNMVFNMVDTQISLTRFTVKPQTIS